MVSSKRTLPEAMKKHQWKPGQSGNPKGRPKRLTLEEHIRKVLDEPVDGTDGWDGHEALARVIVNMMVKRNAPIIKEYMEREWPKIQRHELSGDGGGPIEVASESDWTRFASALDRLEARSKPVRVNGNGAAKSNGNGSA